MGKILHDEQGQDLVEYSLLLLLVAIAAAAMVAGFGGGLSSAYSNASERFAAAVGS